MSKRITFSIDREVTLDAIWYDAEWYDEMRVDGLSHDDALLSMVREAVQEDPTSILWESFGPGEELASEFVKSITRIDVVAA